MKTYAETQGRKPFDWFAWLEKATTKPPTEADQGAKNILSRSWVTCACGNQCAIIPRCNNNSDPELWRGQPLDMRLNSLGGDFHLAVVDGSYLKALGILCLIERRSAVLIATEKAKLAKKRAAKKSPKGKSK